MRASQGLHNPYNKVYIIAMSKKLVFDLSLIVVVASVGLMRVNGIDAPFTGMGAHQIRVYLLHTCVGLFFGWALYSGTAGAFAMADRKSDKALTIAAIVSPVLFLVVIHQTRNVINDGPGALGVACGYLLAVVAAAIMKTPDNSPHGN